MNKYYWFALFLLSIYNYGQEPNYQEGRTYLKKNENSPDTYILEKFKHHDIILLGEDHAIQDNLDFVKKLIPKLYNQGITNLGMEFGAFEKQNDLDSLIINDVYDEQKARDLMYFYNVGWAYKEYTDIYKAAWEFNKTLTTSEKKFRVLNLSYQYQWRAYDGGTKIEELGEVFDKGHPNLFRYKVVENEVLSKNEKALLLVGKPHAFTKYKEHQIDGNDQCKFKNESLGNRLHKKYADKIFSVILHAPFYNIPGVVPFILSPGKGEIENIMRLNGNRPIGFDLNNSPLGRITDSSNYGRCYSDFSLNQLFDGYIFLTPFSKMKNCSIDSAFFKGKSWNETKSQMPDPYWHSEVESLSEYWSQIRAYQDVKMRYKLLIENTIPVPEYGKINRIKGFDSKFVSPRNIDIWLPPDYSAKEKYAVLYMHDGQMLFDKSSTWNNQEWEADETLAKLIHQQKIKKTIVVGIWNTGAYRHSEYFPEKPISLLDTKTKEKLIQTDLKGKAQADNYLKFIVKELKPYIDSNFATHDDVANTFIAGSSMGGLISMYAVSEYPQVFGGAACLSTHWVGDVNMKGDKIPNAFNEYLKDNLPKNRKFYFDYGTKGLDSLYKPYQKMIDKTLKEKGYTKENWKTIEFQGKDHSEQSWSNRFTIPLTFLLSK